MAASLSSGEPAEPESTSRPPSILTGSRFVNDESELKRKKLKLEC
jgi:hypothetical protein